MDTSLPFADFHQFASAYGWSWGQYLDCPQKVLAYCGQYIEMDQAVEAKRYQDMAKRG